MKKFILPTLCFLLIGCTNKAEWKKLNEDQKLRIDINENVYMIYRYDAYTKDIKYKVEHEDLLTSITVEYNYYSVPTTDFYSGFTVSYSITN